MEPLKESSFIPFYCILKIHFFDIPITIDLLSEPAWYNQNPGTFSSTNYQGKIEISETVYNGYEWLQISNDKGYPETQRVPLI